MSKKKTKKLNFNKISEIRTNQGAYKVIFRKIKRKDFGGLCYAPVKPNYIRKSKIVLDPNNKEKDFLRICIDELIHANLWAIDNEYVADMSLCISEFLWELGFRLKDK